MAEQEVIANPILEQNGADTEKELLEKMTSMELGHTKEIEEYKNTIQQLKKELELQNETGDTYKTKVESLELELTNLKNRDPQTLSQAQQNQIEKIKQMSDEMLTKAKGVIFDRTKVCKNQELQIEALNAQVTSLKEVLSITKDLLEIRNLEVTHLQDKMNVMEQKIAAEHQRRDLMDKKLEQMVRMNQDLKDEYQIQLRIFNALKSKYHEHAQIEKQNDSTNSAD